MRVVVPYVSLWPETKAALDATGRTIEYVNLGRDNMTAYGDLLANVWHEGRGFLVVEQDIVPFPGAMDELEACPEPWCGRPYWIGTQFDAYLGFTKFSDALVREQPGVTDAIDQLPFDGTPKRYWGRLDTRLSQVLRDNYGLHIHKHYPCVEHLNPDKALRGAINCAECGEPLSWATVLRTPPPWPCEHTPPLAMGDAPIVQGISTPETINSGLIVNCQRCGEPINPIPGHSRDWCPCG